MHLAATVDRRRRQSDPLKASGRIDWRRKGPARVPKNQQTHTLTHTHSRGRKTLTKRASQAKSRVESEEEQNSSTRIESPRERALDRRPQQVPLCRGPIIERELAAGAARGRRGRTHRPHAGGFCCCCWCWVGHARVRSLTPLSVGRGTANCCVGPRFSPERFAVVVLHNGPRRIRCATSGQRARACSRFGSDGFPRVAMETGAGFLRRPLTSRVAAAARAFAPAPYTAHCCAPPDAHSPIHPPTHPRARCLLSLTYTRTLFFCARCSLSPSVVEKDAGVFFRLVMKRQSSLKRSFCRRANRVFHRKSGCTPLRC